MITAVKLQIMIQVGKMPVAISRNFRSNHHSGNVTRITIQSVLKIWIAKWEVNAESVNATQTLDQNQKLHLDQSQHLDQNQGLHLNLIQLSHSYVLMILMIVNQIQPCRIQSLAHLTALTVATIIYVAQMNKSGVTNVAQCFGDNGTAPGINLALKKMERYANVLVVNAFVR